MKPTKPCEADRALHTKTCIARLVAVGAVLLTGCQTPQAPSAAQTAVKQMDVNGARLSYVDEGQGVPVVFVPAALGDYRTWDRQRAVLAGQYRTIAFSQRYFGAGPWGQDWPRFGVPTHAADLVTFIRALNAGPVHLVAWSYSGHIALDVALEHPELIRSVFVYEPSAPTYVEDPADQKALGNERGAMFGPAVQALKEGDAATAARLLLDGVDNRKNVFEGWPAASQAIVMDNARTMPLLLLNAEAPPPITCQQLGQIKPPVAIARGELDRPFFRIIADHAAKCMPRGERIVVPNASHLWPGQSPQAFGKTVLAFVNRH